MPYLSAFGAVLTKSSLSGTKLMYRFHSHSQSARVADTPQRLNVAYIRLICFITLFR